MRKIDGIIEVEQVLEIIKVGTTMPVRCRLTNGMDVVVKYMKNPFGQRVLINELIGSCIADELGLTIPEYGVCNLSEDVIITTNNNEDIDIKNAGNAFYTRDYSSTVPPSRQLLTFVKSKQVEKLILFDHVVNNCDRHIGNLLLDVRKEAEKIPKCITEEKLKNIRMMIPQKWVDSVGSYQVDLMFEILKLRIESIGDLSNLIIEEMRK